MRRTMVRLAEDWAAKVDVMAAERQLPFATLLRVLIVERLREMEAASQPPSWEGREN